MVSIVIVNYNDWNVTKAFVLSILNYTILDHIIVVDNCSSDNSYEQLKVLSVHEKVEVLRSAKNGGYGYGNNIGLKNAYEKYNSEYVIISNSDVIVEEKTIVSMVTAMKEDEEVSIIAPVMCDANGKKEYNCGWLIPKGKWGFFSFNTPLLNRFTNRNLRYILKNSQNDLKVVDTDAVAGSLFMIRSKVFFDIGGFDENVFLYYEETILGIKLKKKNKRTCILKEESFIHNHSSSIGKIYNSRKKRSKLLWESKRYILKNYYNATKTDLVCFSLLNCIFDTIAIIRDSLRQIHLLMRCLFLY